jgi:hypothetical protein
VTVAESASESLARQIVERVLGVPIEPCDPGGGPERLPDFLIQTEAGPVPLEVTTAADQAALATDGARRKKDWSTQALAHNWSVSLLPTFSVGRFHSRRVELLAALEAAGVTELHIDEPVSDIVKWVSDECIQLGVRALTEVGDAGPDGAILFFGEHSAGSTGADLVVRAVELEAWDDGNREKLGGGGELFVWVDASLHAEVAAMSFNTLPDHCDPPPEVVRLWAAPGPYESKSKLAKPVWRWTSTGGWVDLGAI